MTMYLPVDHPISVIIPGEPVAQGRGRIVWPKGRPRPAIMDPAKSRNWKAVAVSIMAQARPGGAVAFPKGPLRVEILAVFTCPRGDWRKKGYTPRRRHTKARGDCDNVAKGCLDACTRAGLWTDDSQVAVLFVEKWIGAQGEAPFVSITIGQATE